jgi:YheC/D like ATP-grasp
MTRTKVTVTVLPSGNHNEMSILIDDSLIKKHKIVTDSPVTLRYGAAQREVRIMPVKRNTSNPSIRLHAHLAKLLSIQGNELLSLSYKQSSRTMIIGPLIGVMLRKIHENNTEQLFGNQSSFCTEMSEACRKFGASVFFFTQEDIQPSHHTVRGWVQGHNNNWEHQTFPTPNILYNRLTSRVIEKTAKVQQFMKDIKAYHGTQIFNEKYLSKHEVFDALGHSPNVQSYLPESHLLRNSKILKSMLTKHSVVFLKPVKGSLGRGIIRIRRGEDGSYHADNTILNGLRKQTHATYSKLVTHLSGKVKSQSYQIQQGIDIMSVNGRPVDFRALVQRGSTGNWGISSIVARIAGNQTFVSNLARGGTLSTISGALEKSNLHQHLHSSIASKLRKCAVEIALGIEEQIPFHFAELGIDLAVDVRGRVWLIEVNSKPSKEDNSPLQVGKIRPSVKQIIKYSLFLTK